MKSPIILPSEIQFAPIGNILNILKEHDNLFVNSTQRVSYDVAQQIRRKLSDIISWNASPSIKSRSSTAMNTSSELFLSLLAIVKKSSENIETYFGDLSAIVSGIDSQATGWVHSAIILSLKYSLTI